MNLEESGAGCASAYRLGQELWFGHQRRSPAVASGQFLTQVIKFVDRYMKEGRNVLSGYDASEGALYILFLAVLAAHPKAPAFLAPWTMPTMD